MEQLSGQGGVRDVYQAVTDSILRILETGARPWVKPWKEGSTVASVLPLRANGQRYRGINVLILWAAMEEGGYASPYWMTYQQAHELGGQVRKGEKGTMVVYYGVGQAKLSDSGDEGAGKGEEDRRFRFLKTFHVFNAGQIENLPETFRAQGVCESEGDEFERIVSLEDFVTHTGARIRTGGNRAYYRQDADFIAMPAFSAFKSAEFYYSTLAHELTHWTRHASRLNRAFGCITWGDEGYAKEELVAELGAAFLGAEFGFAPEHLDDHAGYMSSWLKVLKDDRRFIFVAAAKAQAAADFLLGGPNRPVLSEAA